MRVILAINPFDSETSFSQDSVQKLKEWSSQPGVEIRPVFVRAVPSASEEAVDPPQIDSSIIRMLEAFAPLTTLYWAHGNRKKEAETLIHFAEEQGADLIAVASNQPPGVEKKVLGSFAESLLLKSEIPILFLKEGGPPGIRQNKVLFATDFSNASKQAFTTFLKQMACGQPEVIIHHAIQLPQFAAAAPVYAQALGLLPKSYWEERREDAEAKGAEFVALAKGMGLPARLLVINQVPSIERSILETIAVEGVKLLAMVSVSKPLQVFLMGSVSRAVLQNNQTPIWICGPQCVG